MTRYDPIVCVCSQRTEDEICAVIRAGATTVPAVRAALGSPVVCGQCNDDIEELIEDTAH